MIYTSSTRIERAICVIDVLNVLQSSSLWHNGSDCHSDCVCSNGYNWDCFDSTSPLLFAPCLDVQHITQSHVIQLQVGHWYTWRGLVPGLTRMEGGPGISTVDT